MPRFQSSHYHSQPTTKPSRTVTMTTPPVHHIHSQLNHKLASSVPSRQIPGILSIPSKSAPSPPRMSGTARRNRQASQPAPSGYFSNKDASKVDPLRASLPSTGKFSTTAASTLRANRKIGTPLKQSRKPREKQAPVNSIGRVGSPLATQDDATQSDNPRSNRIKPRTPAHKSKPRTRARSMSSTRPEDILDEKIDGASVSISSRPRTVTLNDEPTLLMFHSGRETRKLLENSSLVQPLSKVLKRSKAGKPSSKRGNKPRSDKPRARACSSDDADFALPRDSDSAPRFYSRSPTPTPSPVDIGNATGSSYLTQPANMNLSVSAPTTAALIDRPSVALLPTSQRNHGRAKSTASVLDSHGSQCETPTRNVKKGWDMPSSAIVQDLTWQQLEKKLPRSLQLEIPAYRQASLRATLKEPQSSAPTLASRSHGSELKPTDASNAKRHRSALARTPSANSVLPNGPTPSSLDLFGALSIASHGCQSPYTLSAPPSPSPDRVDPHFHVAAMIPSSDELRGTQPRHIPTADETSLTWQQAIMRSPPKSTNLFPQPNSSEGIQLEDFKAHKKSHNQASLAAFNTPVKTVAISKKGAAHSVNRPNTTRPQFDDRPRRRNSTSSTGYSHTRSATDGGKRTFEIKKSGLFDELNSLEPKSFPPTFQSKSSVAGNFPFGTLPLGSSQSGNLIQRDQSLTPYHIHHAIAPSTRSAGQVPASEPYLSGSSTLFTGRMKENRMVTPNKSKSTGELLSILTPNSRPEAGAPGKGPMYAGPQFHNSPSPATLPAPKFGFGP